MNRITLSFDGASRPNGQCGMGFVVMRDDTVIATHGTLCEGYTVNEAEYGSLILGLQHCLERGYKEISVRGDSQVVVKQMTGEYQCRAANLLDWHAEAKDLAERFDRISFRWIPRKKNKLADAATRDMMEPK